MSEPLDAFLQCWNISGEWEEGTVAEIPADVRSALFPHLRSVLRSKPDTTIRTPVIQFSLEYLSNYGTFTREEEDEDNDWFDPTSPSYIGCCSDVLLDTLRSPAASGAEWVSIALRILYIVIRVEGVYRAMRQEGLRDMVCSAFDAFPGVGSVVGPACMAMGNMAFHETRAASLHGFYDRALMALSDPCGQAAIADSAIWVCLF